MALGDPDRAVTDLSPQLHNFVVVVSILMLVAWWVKAAVRARRVYELKVSSPPPLLSHPARLVSLAQRQCPL